MASLTNQTAGSEWRKRDECRLEAKRSCSKNAGFKMTAQEFFSAYQKGTRQFKEMDFEYLPGFSGVDLSDVVIEDSWFNVDCRGSKFRNAKFIRCNIKEIDLREADLTGAEMTECLVECAQFKGAIVENFRFYKNYYYGLTLEQKDLQALMGREK
jgi:uncharacterized protein YjbI with pentapeptide repeats